MREKYAGKKVERKIEIKSWRKEKINLKLINYFYMLFQIYLKLKIQKKKLLFHIHVLELCLKKRENENKNIKH